MKEQKSFPESVSQAGPQCVILAGGLATRLQSLAKDRPKSLIPISGRPFLSYQLDLLKEQGIGEILICIGYLGNQIEDYCRTELAQGMKINFSHDGPSTLGTWGALKNAAEKGLLQNSFFVMYGDSFLPTNFNRVWNQFKESNAMALMTIFKNENRFDKSNVHFDPSLSQGGRIISYEKKIETTATREKYKFIDYGLSCLKRELLLENRFYDYSDLSDVFKVLSQEAQLDGIEVQERFYEIGSHSGIEAFEKWVQKNL